MIAILSPAKSLELKKEYLKTDTTTPIFLTDANAISKVIKKWTPKKIQSIQGVSEKLADLNFDRNQLWGTIENKFNLRPAIYTFDGEVYSGLNAYELNLSEIEYANQHLKILSGLYGLLRPLDIMEPYRLEMGTEISIGKHSNLNSYWKNKLTNEIENELKGHNNQWLVNLASNEYSKSIDLKKFGEKVIHVDFLEEEKGAFKNISFFSKKARGLMARYIVQNKIDIPEDLKSFDIEHYSFNSQKSKNNHLIFSRKNYK